MVFRKNWFLIVNNILDFNLVKNNCVEYNSSEFLISMFVCKFETKYKRKEK